MRVRRDALPLAIYLMMGYVNTIPPCWMMRRASTAARPLFSIVQKRLVAGMSAGSIKQ
jgi:ABC-type maltose transport system permease subunit